MKRLILFFSLLASLALNGLAQEVKLVPSADNDGRMDTVVVSTLSDVEEDDAEEESIVRYEGYNGSSLNEGTTIALVAIIMIFGLPIFVLLLALWFRYKNKQAKYRLAAEALAQGREIPKEFYKEESAKGQNSEVLGKGIRNICLGIGLGVFLWMMTDEEGIAAIGFLIFCMGVGQVITAYATRPQNNDKDRDLERR